MQNRSQALLAVLSVATAAIAGGPAESVTAALADAQTQPAELRPSLRYLSLHGVPEKDRPAFLKVLAFQTNSLSREADLVPLVVVKDLVRLNLLDYAWDRSVWEKMAPMDPYYHVRLGGKSAVPEVVPVPVVPLAVPVALEGVQFFVDGPGSSLVEIDRANIRPGSTVYVRERLGGPLKKMTAPALKREEKKEEKLLTAHAPWLPTAEITALALALSSEAPLLRADWFVFQTGAQFKRGGAGYYDFLGFKNRADIEKFTSLDVAAAKRVRREIAAIVSESGVAVNNRQIVRYQTLTGGYWATLDVEDNEGEHNAVEVLNGDFKHQAEEIYAPHMNGLFVYGASDADGKLQDKVPVKFAPDHVSTSNSREIEPMFSCVRCHEEGLRPIDDWARKVYQEPLKLTSPDYQKAKRLQRLYLSDLPGQLQLDQEAYARALKKVNGLTPKDNAQAYARAWQRYADTSLGLEETAFELGVEPKAWRAALEGYARPGNVNPVLAGLLARQPARIRREHWHDRYALAQSIVKGVKP